MYLKSDKKGNLPLHLALKYSLKHYSRSVVLDVVDVLVNVTRDELDVPNANGTTPNRLLRGLEVKKEIEDRHDWDSSSSTSSDDETNGIWKKMKGSKFLFKSHGFLYEK